MASSEPIDYQTLPFSELKRRAGQGDAGALEYLRTSGRASLVRSIEALRGGTLGGVRRDQETLAQQIAQAAQPIVDGAAVAQAHRDRMSDLGEAIRRGERLKAEQAAAVPRELAALRQAMERSEAREAAAESRAMKAEARQAAAEVRESETQKRAERRDRWMVAMTAAALVFAAISTTVAVIALSAGG